MSSSKTILLARHGAHAEIGRVLSGRSEIALDARGRADAAALADHLSGRRLGAIHSSPRARTRETAEAVARRTGLTVRIAPALDEVDFGRFAGQAFATLADDPDWHHWNAARADARCPGGETMGEAVERAMAYVAALPDGDDPILCVTHCDIIRGMVAQVLGLPFDRIFALECASASLTSLGFDRQDVRLLSLNEGSWLRAL